MSFAVIKRVIDEETEVSALHTVNTDLQVASSKELERSLATIQKELAARKNPDRELLAHHLQHIDRELATSPLEFSLEHLEMYSQYLARLVKEALSEEQRTTQARLLSDVHARIKGHPLASESRSGDVAGNEEDFSYAQRESSPQSPGLAREASPVCARLPC